MDEREIVVTAKELEKLGFCVQGARTLANKYGIDFRKFLREGISVSELRKINDPLAHKLADKALKSRGGD